MTRVHGSRRLSTYGSRPHLVETLLEAMATAVAKSHWSSLSFAIP